MGFLCKTSTSPQSTTTVVQQPSIPGYIDAAQQGIITKASDVANEPYQQYTGQRVAGLTPDQQAAYDKIRGQQGQYQPGFDQAFGLTGAGATTWPNADVDAYMNPYTQNVIDIAKREAVRDRGILQGGINTQAVNAGGFGGSRHGVVDAEANRNLTQQLSDIEATGLDKAYTNAQGMFTSDADRLLKAGSQFGSLASGQQSAGLADAAALENIGATQQGLAQANADVAYSDFAQQRDYPKAQAEWLSNIIRGIPTNVYGSTQTQTGTAAGPSALSQLTGAGLTGLAGYQAFKGIFKNGGRVQKYADGGLVRSSFLPQFGVKDREAERPAPEQIMGDQAGPGALYTTSKGAKIRLPTDSRNLQRLSNMLTANRDWTPELRSAVEKQFSVAGEENLSGLASLAAGVKDKVGSLLKPNPRDTSYGDAAAVEEFIPDAPISDRNPMSDEGDMGVRGLTNTSSPPSSPIASIGGVPLPKRKPSIGSPRGFGDMLGYMPNELKGNEMEGLTGMAEGSNLVPAEGGVSMGDAGVPLPKNKPPVPTNEDGSIDERYLPLLQAGLTLMGSDKPYFAQGLADAGKAGIAAYQTQKKDKAEKEVTERKLRVAEGELDQKKLNDAGELEVKRDLANLRREELKWDTLDKEQKRKLAAAELEVVKEYRRGTLKNDEVKNAVLSKYYESQAEGKDSTRDLVQMQRDTTLLNNLQLRLGTVDKQTGEKVPAPVDQAMPEFARLAPTSPFTLDWKYDKMMQKIPQKQEDDIRKLAKSNEQERAKLVREYGKDAVDRFLGE